MTKLSDELAPSLKERQGAFTRQLILDAAVAQLEAGTGVPTLRAVAQRANLAERTVFRYFASREELLDALAPEVSRRMELPPLPRAPGDLVDAPRALYRAFESHVLLTKAALHSELYERIRETTARERWNAVKALLDEWAPAAGERERKLAAANIRYVLSASSWHYYRFYFAFSLADSVAAATQVVRLALADLRAAGGIR